VELLQHVQPDGRGLLGAAAEHAVYIFALAERLRHVFVRVMGSLNGDVVRTAELAKMWEARADEIVGRWNRITGRNGDGRAFSHLLSRADKAADALENVAYLLTLVPPDHVRDGLSALGHLPDLVSRSAKEYVRCLDYAKDQGRTRAPADIAAMLLAADRIATLEHESDVAKRDAEARLVQGAATFRELHVLSRVRTASKKPPTTWPGAPCSSKITCSVPMARRGTRMIDPIFIGGLGAGTDISPTRVGNKAANLARLDRLGLRVPPALALDTEVCRTFAAGALTADDVREPLVVGIKRLEHLTGLSFGSGDQMLLSVRSSPPVSMPACSRPSSRRPY
jgi:hypothetical protein